MRRFYIQNDKNERIALQYTKGVFLTEPGGWGYQNNNSYMETEGYFIATERQIAQIEKTGTLTFPPPNAYSDYTTFIDWLQAASALTLIYAPGDTEYFIDVDVDYVEKAELGPGGCLNVPIAFFPLSPIYVPEALNFFIDGDTVVNAKTYDYVYDYQYSGGAVSGELEFSFDAQIDSDFELVFRHTNLGAISAPVINVNRGTEVIGQIDLSGISVEPGQSLRYSGIPTGAGVVRVSPSGQDDVTDSLGLSADYPSFFRLPPNTSLKIAMSAASLANTSLVLSIRRNYRSV